MHDLEIDNIEIDHSDLDDIYESLKYLSTV